VQKFHDAHEPPQAARKKHETRIHGKVMQDEYFWMRERGSKEILDYLNAENAYTDHVMSDTVPLQDELYHELVSRIKETDLSVPVRRGDYYYYSRTEKGKQYPIYCRKFKSAEAPETVMLDMNELAGGSEYFSFGVIAVSPDHRYVAYSSDTAGAEVYTLYIKDMQTGKLLPEVITNTATSAEWAEDNRTIFYVTLDEAKRPYKLYRHTLGETASKDVEVYHEKDEGFFLSIDKTRDRKYLILDLSSKTTSEEHFLDALKPAGQFSVIEPRRELHEYSVEHHAERFFILTNDSAKNFRLMETPDTAPARVNWKEVIPHRKDVKLDHIDVFQDHLVIFERSKGLNLIQICVLSTGLNHYLEFPEPVYTAWGGSNPEFDSTTLRFGYSSLVTPSSVYDYDMNTRTRELRKQQEVLGGYDPAQYLSERVYAAAEDGTEVPVSMVYRKGLKRDGTNPCFLYGYGSYGISMDPGFSSNRLALVDRGFIFAIAHIRGGGDLGRPWYEDGKLLKKKNTFTDFIACAEYLIKEKYTAPSNIVISGGSAGGLLMGAVLNQRPDLFNGVIMHVPFVDVLNTMLDKNLPLTVTEYDEWGNPEDEEKFFSYIASYSPYDNLKEASYPNVLVTGGLNDPRVQYWEPAKWTARLRGLKKDRNLLLLKMNMGAGHGGPSGRYDYLKEIAFDYAFIFKIMGIAK